MIGAFKSIFDFAGKERKNISASVVWGIVNAIFHALQLGAVYMVVLAVTDENRNRIIALYALGLMLLSITGKIVTQYVSQLQRTHAGYFMVADKRLEIGEKLKTVPMGFFGKKNLSGITAVATTTLTDVENAAPVALVTSLGGFITSAVFALAMLLFDWRIGCIVLLGMVCLIMAASAMEKRAEMDVPLRQEAQETLAMRVFEVIQGMSVVKAFNLDFNKGKKVDLAIDEDCEKNTRLEISMDPYLFLQQVILNVFSVVIIIVSVCFYLEGTMTLANCLMMLIASFMMFEQLKVAGSSVANLRVTENSIKRANAALDVPAMPEGSIAQTPSTHEIRFENVEFSYRQNANGASIGTKILDGVDITFPEKKLTAIVGPSGSGKTTICNLIARFWDADKGKITLGGTDIREYTIAELMSNVSMVFQNVYLFADTIENNIKFGSPDATHEEVVAAARKACCDDFIEALPNGYNTVIGEGGASLSGGEKQRISIARAMLKSAPIVIFDEATASVDPENEDRLQSAIEALTLDKTVIMIAHRLKTVRNADQIIVLDGGKIVQKGRHDELMAEKGIYADFVGRRQKEISWKI